MIIKTLVCLLTLSILACNPVDIIDDKIIVSGEVNHEVKLLTIGDDTISVVDGYFSDTINRDVGQYNYLKLDSWKWSKIVYLRPGIVTNLNFQNGIIETDSKLNDYLLNLDHILMPYTAKWSSGEQEFIHTWQTEFSLNIRIIDDYFKDSDIPSSIIDELKNMEYMKRGHRTANFISFQERNENFIDRSIYKFVDSIDLHNPRLAFHVNNRNFQYYYFMDKVSDEVPDSIYPFAIIDTAKKYVLMPEYKEMIITAAIKNGFYNESVDHDRLFKIYEEEIGDIEEDDEIVKLYNRIQSLKPGNKAPDIGSLLSMDGSSLSIDDLGKKNILLSAWGTWCPYCKEELPHLKKLLAKHKDKLHGVAVSLDNDTVKWEEYINDNKWKGTHLIDPNKKSIFRKNYMASGTNIHYLIDKNGVIRSNSLKPSDSRLDSLIATLE